MPALFSVVVLLPGNTAASFGRLLRSVPRTCACLAGEHKHPWGWLAAEIHTHGLWLAAEILPGTRTCLYLSFSLPFFICGALPGEPRPSMVLLPGNHVLPSRSEPRTQRQCLPMNHRCHPCHPYRDLHITATGFIGLHDDGGPTGCWTSWGISPSTNALGLR
ncbi:hypothetical protein K438DRAFT_1862134, partial [Mycena galopus ATCC 62051]